MGILSELDGYFFYCSKQFFFALHPLPQLSLYPCLLCQKDQDEILIYLIAILNIFRYQINIHYISTLNRVNMSLKHKKAHCFPTQLLLVSCEFLLAVKEIFPNFIDSCCFSMFKQQNAILQNTGISPGHGKVWVRILQLPPTSPFQCSGNQENTVIFLYSSRNPGRIRVQPFGVPQENKLLTLLGIFAIIFIAIKACSENATPGRQVVSTTFL